MADESHAGLSEKELKSMKTLADFKRRLTVGTKLRVTLLGGPLVINGNCGQTVLSPPAPQDRTVGKVQSNSVAFSKPGSIGLSWLTWPKAADFQVEDGKAIISMEGTRILQYEFLPDGR